jgi:hypothetical protein
VKRDALDTLLVRVPPLATLMAGGVHRLNHGSSLRRRLLNLQVKRGFSAMARSDVELLVLSYEPDAEVWMRSMAGVGMDECYRGHDGIRKVYADLDDVFGDWSWTIRAIVDGGDRIAVRGDFVAYGRTSGVKTALSDGATAIRFSPRGRIAWQEWFVEDGWEQALAAIGLSE